MKIARLLHFFIRTDFIVIRIFTRTNETEHKIERSLFALSESFTEFESQRFICHLFAYTTVNIRRKRLLAHSERTTHDRHSTRIN